MNFSHSGKNINNENWVQYIVTFWNGFIVERHNAHFNVTSITVINCLDCDMIRMCVYWHLRFSVLKTKVVIVYAAYLWYWISFLSLVCKYLICSVTRCQIWADSWQCMSVDTLICAGSVCHRIIYYAVNSKPWKSQLLWVTADPDLFVVEVQCFLFLLMASQVTKWPPSMDFIWALFCKQCSVNWPWKLYTHLIWSILKETRYTL